MKILYDFKSNPCNYTIKFVICNYTIEFIMQPVRGVNCKLICSWSSREESKQKAVSYEVKPNYIQLVGD